MCHFYLQVDPWVTKNGEFPLPTEDQNCILVTVTKEDIDNVVKHVPKLDTLVSLYFNISFQYEYSSPV